MDNSTYDVINTNRSLFVFREFETTEINKMARDQSDYRKSN